MRITLPFSFWLAIAVNLPYVEAFTPPSLFSLPGRFGSCESVGNRDRTSRERGWGPFTNILGNNDKGHQRLQKSGQKPFYFADIPSATSLSAAASSGDGIEINDNRKKYGQAEVARARTAYLDWCSDYRKTPEEKRFHQFVDNFLVMEAMARKQGTQIRLNEFADCTAEEYQKIMSKGVGAGGGPGQSRLNKDLKMVDQTSSTKKKPVPAATPTTSSGTAASILQNATASGAGTTTNSIQAAVQQAKTASQQASQVVESTQQKIGDAVSSSTVSKPPQASAATPAKKSSTIIPPDEMGNDDAKILAQQKEQQRAARRAQAEAAQRAELERARLRKEQEQAKRDAELAALKAKQEKAQQEAIAEQRRKVEEAERKRRELVARAEAAQRAEAAAAKARREAEEQKRKEEEAAAAAAKAKAEEEERQRKLKEEEERLRKERELAAEEARQKAEALAAKKAEEARLKKEEEERQAAAEAKRKEEELAAKKAEEARLKKEREEKAAAEAKQKAEELARLKAEQARLKKEQQERAAAEAARKAEEEARRKAEEKARLEKEKEERAAAEAKRKKEELERLAKEREILLEKKRQQELEAKRKRDEAVLLKRKQEGEADQKKLAEATSRLVSVLAEEQRVLSKDESMLEAGREKAVLEHKQKILKVLESRAADLEASKLEVSKETKTLLSTLTNARSNLRELETKLAADRQKIVIAYQKRQKEMTEAERKQKAELEAQRQREQRELAARRKIEEDKRRQEEIISRQKAEEEAKKRALEEKRRLEAIAREKRKAEEELRVKNLAAQAEKEAEVKRAREEKRQKEITEKAKAAALAAKKDAKEKKKKEDLKRIEDMKNEDTPTTPVAGQDKPAEKKISTTVDRQSDNSQVSSMVKNKDKDSDLEPKKEAVTLSDEEKEKSLDEQLAELTSMIDQLQRESDDAESDKPPVEAVEDEAVAKDDSSNSSINDSSINDSKDETSNDVSAASSSKETINEIDEEAKKKAKEEEDLRIRSAYLDWCISYSKKPDMTRIEQFKKNYLLIEEFAKENGKEIKLNEYADCTATEYERAMKEKEDAKKREEEEQKKREEEAAASYKAALDEASQLFGVDGNTTAVAKDDSFGAAGGSAKASEDDTIVTGDPDDVWKTGEPTMSVWQPEDDGESMWASEGGASVWESRESSEWGEIDESYSTLGTVDPDDPEVRRRVRSAYSNWCREYNKETDESRFPRFKTNYLKMEQMAWEQGSEITLNEFADCSPEEYRNAVGRGSSHEEERLERLRKEQEAEAEQKASSRTREDRIERLRREQEEQAAKLSAKRTVESVWKVGEPKKRVKDIRVDWDQDETAAMEEVERMALAKAEAAARRVEEARKNKIPRSPASTEPPPFRPNKNDVDRQLRQKAMDERRIRDDGDYFSRNEAEGRRNIDEEQSKLEEEWAVRSRAVEENDRLKRPWDGTQVQPDVGRQPSTPDFKNATPRADPSPAFNLGSIFGIGNNGKASSPPSRNDPVVDPNEPIVKPPGSFEPKVKAPAYDNKAWQDQYIKNYNPTVGGGFRNGESDSDSKSQLEPPSPSSGDSYFMDLSNGLEDRGRTPEPVPPSNDEWYQDSLSQPRPPHSPPDPFSSLEGRSSSTPGGVAPDEAELDATPSRFVEGAESYLGDLSPPRPSNGAASSSGYSEKDAVQSFAPPATPTPEASGSKAASPPRGASISRNYLDNLQSQFPERIESAYRDWCQYYGKEASEDRLRIFASNFLAVEKYHRETGVSLILNELADMTSDEFQSNGKNGKA